MHKDEIVKKHPSLCYSCEHNRCPVNDDLIQLGFTGCTEQENFKFVEQSGEVTEGRVIMTCKVFQRFSCISVISKMIRRVEKCERFKLLK